MGELSADWPDDATGDVFRRLVEHDFDFIRKYSVDFFVDFDVWPPSEEALARLKQDFGHLALMPPEGDLKGAIQFRTFGEVTYERVTTPLSSASASMERFGGVCNDWGVMQDDD